MTKTDDDVFLKNVPGVKPIKKRNILQKRIKKTPQNLINKISKIEKTKKTNVEEKETKTNPITKPSIEKGKINKSLRRGFVPIDRKIDFHGKTLTEAENQFVNSIKKNFKEKNRCILFVTGKGLNIKDRAFSENVNRPKLFYGKIRASFLEWVQKPELSKYILSFEKANIRHGGDGAFYVYLRKNKN